MSATSMRQQRPILSVRDRERLRNQIRAQETILSGGVYVPQNKRISKSEGGGLSQRRAGRYQSFIDKDVSEDQQMVMRKIASMRRVLDAGSPAGLSKRDKVRIEKQIAEDREILKKSMCPKSLYYKRPGDADFDKGVQANLREHSPEFQRRAARYKNNLRQLDPDNPNAASLENIRPESAA